MSKDCTIRVTPDGHADRLGIVTPVGTTVVHKVRGTLILNIPGHRYWGGRGTQHYAPQAYEVYRVLAEENDERGALLKSELIVSFNPRGNGDR